MFYFKIKTRGSLDSIPLTWVIYIDNELNSTKQGLLRAQVLLKKDRCPAKIITKVESVLKSARRNIIRNSKGKNPVYSDLRYNFSNFGY